MRLKSNRNLRVISISNEELLEPEIGTFVNEVIENFMGDLIDKKRSSKKPVQMVPIAKIQNDVKYLKRSDDRLEGENVLKYFTELSIYINGRCTLNCASCQTVFKQFLCCTITGDFGGQKIELDCADIEVLLDTTQSSPLSKINILGGDIFYYSQLTQLLNILLPLPLIKNFYLHYLNAITHLHELIRLNSSASHLKLLVTFPVEEQIIFKLIDELRKRRITYSIIYFITDEFEFKNAEELNTIFKISCFQFQPYYNGENRKFFIDNLLIDKEELIEEKLSMHEIISREIVNLLDFGRLTVMNNGKIFANINAKPLGDLKENSIRDLLFKEISRGTSWRRTRERVSPCNKCPFHNLCPPLSNLNTALGQNNWCNINDVRNF